MTLTAQYNDRLEIRRNALTSPGAVDEWNQPGYGVDSVVATVDGAIIPLSIREVALLTDAGAQIGDFRAFVDAFYVLPDGTQAPLVVLSSDRIRDVASGSTYEIRSVVDAAGRGHHWDLTLRRVVD